MGKCLYDSCLKTSKTVNIHILMRQNQPYKKNQKVIVFRANHLAVGSMVIRIVEFSSGGYKIRESFA